MNRDYIILDLEWNQGYPGRENPSLPFEVIEIGAVKLNPDKEITDRFDSLVRPGVYKRIYFMTEKVTGITLGDLKDAPSFPEAFDRFIKWCGEDFLFCTWGSMDLTELRRNMDHYGISSGIKGPWPYLDIQKLYSLELADGKSRISLEKAVNALLIDKDEAFHRANGDAYYTAQVFRYLVKRELESYLSYDVYELPSSEEDELYTVFPTYSKYISRGFKEKGRLLNDAEAGSLRCFVCGEKTTKTIPWVSVNGKQYFGMGKCAEHGSMRGHLRIRKDKDGAVYGVKTIRPSKPGDEADLKKKQKVAGEQEKKILNRLRNQSRQILKNTGGSSF